MRTLPVILFLLLLLPACTSDAPRELLVRPYPFPAHNPPTEAGIALGRRLFYDAGLSANGKVSCASCHQQARAFSDGEALSRQGLTGNPLVRHTPGLSHVAWRSSLFWDGGVCNLESLPFAPLSHPDEMGANLEEVISYLQADTAYRKYFAAAFGSDTVTSARLGQALAQFCREIYTEESPYDRSLRGEGSLSAKALKGEKLVSRHCSPCHSGPRFSDDGYHNNGLEPFPLSPGPEQALLGRYRISYDSADLGKFKTPTLRNLAFTAPYMHDGRFASLSEVMDHYRFGLQESPTLDSAFRRKPGKPGISLSDEETVAVLVFLACLNDSSLLLDPGLASPTE